MSGGIQQLPIAKGEKLLNNFLLRTGLSDEGERQENYLGTGKGTMFPLQDTHSTKGWTS